MINCKTCVYHNACSYDVDDCEMYIPVPDVSSTIRILEIEKQCVLRQDTPDCNRDECGCNCCDLIQNADEVISAYDSAINILKRITEKTKEDDSTNDNNKTQNLPFRLDCPCDDCKKMCIKCVDSCKKFREWKERKPGMKKTVDRSKKSNVKCWNCKYWIREEKMCGNARSTKLFREYYHRCKMFEWKEDDNK